MFFDFAVSLSSWFLDHEDQFESDGTTNKFEDAAHEAENWAIAEITS